MRTHRIRASLEWDTLTLDQRIALRTPGLISVTRRGGLFALTAERAQQLQDRRRGYRRPIPRTPAELATLGHWHARADRRVRELHRDHPQVAVYQDMIVNGTLLCPQEQTPEDVERGIYSYDVETRQGRGATGDLLLDGDGNVIPYDPHAATAQRLGITRQQAKAFNFGGPIWAWHGARSRSRQQRRGDALHAMIAATTSAEAEIWAWRLRALREPRRGPMQPDRAWISIADLRLLDYVPRPRSRPVLLARWTDPETGVTHARDLAATRDLAPRPSCGTVQRDVMRPHYARDGARWRRAHAGEWRLESSERITCDKCMQVVEARLLRARASCE